MVQSLCALCIVCFPCCLQVPTSAVHTADNTVHFDYILYEAPEAKLYSYNTCSQVTLLNPSDSRQDISVSTCAQTNMAAPRATLTHRPGLTIKYRCFIPWHLHLPPNGTSTHHFHPSLSLFCQQPFPKLNQLAFVPKLNQAVVSRQPHVRKALWQEGFASRTRSLTGFLILDAR